MVRPPPQRKQWPTSPATRLTRPVLVDLTADDTARALEQALTHGMDLVLANKRPLADRRSVSDGLWQTARARGRRILHEATVGAGLPIIDTYHKLVESGDRVERIEGLLSGTLGYVLSRGIGRGALLTRGTKRDGQGLHRARSAGRPLRHGCRPEGTHPCATARLSGRATPERGRVAGAPMGRDALARRSSSIGWRSSTPRGSAGWTRPRAAGRGAPLCGAGHSGQGRRRRAVRCRHRARSPRSRGRTISWCSPLPGTRPTLSSSPARARAPRLRRRACSTTSCGWPAHEVDASRRVTPLPRVAWVTSVPVSISWDWRWPAWATPCGRSGPIRRGSRSSTRAIPISRPMPTRHTVGLAARAVLERAGDRTAASAASRSRSRKGLPLSGGQGGSAASAVAGAVAVNALLGESARIGWRWWARASRPRRASSGRHADNIAPSLLGGIVLIRSLDPLDLVAAPGAGRAVGRGRAARSATAHRRSACRPAGVRFHAPAGAASGGAGRRDGRGARLAATTRCWAAPSTTASPSRYAPRCCRAFVKPSRPRSPPARWAARSPAAGPPRSLWYAGAAAGERVAAAMAAAYTSCGHRSEVRVAQIDRQGARVIGQSDGGSRHEVSDPAAGQLAVVHRLRKRGGGDRSAPALHRLRRAARDSAPAALP